MRREGEHPTVAAPKIGDAKFESCGGGQFRLKLGGELRLSFRFANNVIDTVKIRMFDLAKVALTGNIWMTRGILNQLYIWSSTVDEFVFQLSVQLEMMLLINPWS